MSMYDVDDSVDVGALVRKVADLETTVANLQGVQKAAHAVDTTKLNGEIAAADSPEAVMAAVTAANREFVSALHGAEAIEGVDV